ncbi:GFA family protein [Chelatococcus reniformis]|uniref:Aldehyde-activating protein n=1 Tax=Chelatococcus reniformis TaxID=1494448 RepID=A0A916XKF3_9HYPH|nr:GFA family protein [Chelatococcus reniformis]GGC77195.1 aldehyde-activating protein [Chelatococcus reniformis]
MLSGGCYCGQVRYDAEAPPFHATLCHCADCRRIAGAASVAWFSVPRASFHFTATAPASFRSSPRVTRRFCGSCGTALTYEHDGLPDEIDVTTASLDDPEAAAPRDHTWTAEKLRWEPLCDSLPVFPGPWDGI